MSFAIASCINLLLQLKLLIRQIAHAALKEAQLLFITGVRAFKSSSELAIEKTKGIPSRTRPIISTETKTMLRKPRHNIDGCY